MIMAYAINPDDLMGPKTLIVNLNAYDLLRILDGHVADISVQPDAAGIPPGAPNKVAVMHMDDETALEKMNLISSEHHDRCAEVYGVDENGATHRRDAS